MRSLADWPVSFSCCLTSRLDVLLVTKAKAFRICAHLFKSGTQCAINIFLIRYNFLLLYDLCTLLMYCHWSSVPVPISLTLTGHAIIFTCICVVFFSISLLHFVLDCIEKYSGKWTFPSLLLFLAHTLAFFHCCCCAAFLFRKCMSHCFF